MAVYILIIFLIFISEYMILVLVGKYVSFYYECFVT